MHEGKLYVLARGRVRGAGGVSAEVADRAGTIFVVDPNVSEPATEKKISQAVRNNATVLVEPTEPPFKLWDRTSNPPSKDRNTDRPYCVLRFHEPTQSFYICAFSGIDKPRRPGQSSFSKNLTDGLLRYDLRTKQWYEVERHNIEAGGSYPHHDPKYNAPPHGWLNGPDNCLALGDWLYAVSKDNSLLVRYDLRKLKRDPAAGAPDSEVVLNANVSVEGKGRQRFEGHSALAYHDGWLYIGTRTSSVIFRIRLNEQFLPVQPIAAQVIARFAPYDPKTGKTADITDMSFDDRGRLYVINAEPARVYRFTPDPGNVFDARLDRERPWFELEQVLGYPVKGENVLVYKSHLYITTGDGYGYQKGADGAVYRVTVSD